MEVAFCHLMIKMVHKEFPLVISYFTHYALQIIRLLYHVLVY